MKKIFNKKKGFSLPIILLVIFLIAGAAVGGYYALTNYVFMPEIDTDFLAHTLEHKFDFGLEFEPSDDQGKVDFNAEITHERLMQYYESMYPHQSPTVIENYADRAYSNLDFKTLFGLSVSQKNGISSTKFELFDNPLNIISDDDNIVISAKQVKDGQYYGVKLSTLMDDLNSSALNPANGKKAALSQEEFDALVKLAEAITKGKDLEDDVDIIMDMVKLCFLKSELGKCELLFDGNTINGVERYGRSMNFVFTKAGILDFLNILIDRLNNPSDKESVSIDRVITYINTVYENDVSLEKIIEDINDFKVKFEEKEDNENLVINVKILYVKTYLSAIEIEGNNEYNGNKERFTWVLDFGANPDKDTRIIFEAKDYEDDKLVSTYNIETNTIVNEGETIFTFSENSVKTYIDITDSIEGVEGTYTSGTEGRLVLNKNLGLGSVNIKIIYDEESTDLLDLDFEFSDTKEMLSFELAYDPKTSDLPLETTLDFYNSCEDLQIPEYINYLTMTDLGINNVTKAFEDYFAALLGALGGSGAAPN